MLYNGLLFRAAGAVFTSLILSLATGPYFIEMMRKLQKKGQPIRLEGPESHLLTKKGTPTMGGLLILLTSLISTLIWCNLHNSYILIILFVTFGHGILGFIDDYLKVTRQKTDGVRGKLKLTCQILIGCVACYYIKKSSSFELHNKLIIPYFKNIILDLGQFYLIFSLFVLLGSSNSVNLTDGLDGLLIVPAIISFFTLAILSYFLGNLVFSNYFKLVFIKDVTEIVVFSGCIIGSGLGFLWFNAPPARIFMGDTGSLALGAALGVISLIIKQEITFAIIGGLFVIEALSVIIQVYYFKLTKGKRVFLMAPIHHHFEKKGWQETTIVLRFWILSVVFALLGLLSLAIKL